MHQSPDNEQNADGSIFDFWISAQSFIKENCYNSRTSDDINIKREPVAKLDKRNKTTSKNFDDDVMSENSETNQEAEFRHRAYKTCFH